MLKIFKRLKLKIHIKELIVKKCLILKRWTKALMVKHSL